MTKRFVKLHRLFTLKPRLCRWPGHGWALWWLWFEVASVRGGSNG